VIQDRLVQTIGGTRYTSADPTAPGKPRTAPTDPPVGGRKPRRSRHAYASPSLIEPSLTTMERQVISARVVHPGAPAVRRSYLRWPGATEPPGWTGGSRVVRMKRVR